MIAQMSSTPLRVAIVGVGYWGPNVVRAFRGNRRVDVVSVCDLSPERRAFIQQAVPGIPVTDSIDAILADTTIEAVALATPVATHTALGRAVIEAGKHLLIEKPLALTAEDADSLVNLAAARSCVLAAGHVYLHHPAIRRLRKEIHRGALGAIAYVTTTRANVPPPDPDVDVIWDLAVHDVAMALDLIEAPPVSVHALGAGHGQDGRLSSAQIHVSYEGGQYSQHSVSWLFPGRIRTLHAAGLEGYAVFDETAEDALVLYGPAVDTRQLPGGSSGALTYGAGSVTRPELDATRPLDAECEAFRAAIQEGTPMAGNGRDAAIVVHVLEAASRSIQSGAPEMLSSLRSGAER